jgi:hypothetical protein
VANYLVARVMGMDTQKLLPSLLPAYGGGQNSSHLWSWWQKNNARIRSTGRTAVQSDKEQRNEQERTFSEKYSDP